jgi:SAM-dependent methyltransferase
MQTTHLERVERQFGPRAQAYVDSAVHSGGEDLDALEKILRQAAPARALDLGCGGGHVSYLMARHAGAVAACDVARDMLEAVETTAQAKGLRNVATTLAAAERLPFEEGAFDFLTCRYSAHHWSDVEAGLREGRRVLKAGARAVFIDVYSPGAPLLDTHLQVVETLRDPSHVRNYSIAEWLGLLTRSGFRTRSLNVWRLRMEFCSWTARMKTPDLNQRMIRSLQDQAAEETRRHFAIESDGSFLLSAMMVEAEAD